jgi:hypothetical protein
MILHEQEHDLLFVVLGLELHEPLHYSASRKLKKRAHYVKSKIYEPRREISIGRKRNTEALNIRMDRR